MATEWETGMQMRNIQPDPFANFMLKFDSWAVWERQVCIKVCRSGYHGTNVSIFSWLCTSAVSTMRQTRRQTGRGNCAGQNVFRVPNRLCFSRLNSSADCHNTDLPLTQRKWPLSTTFKWPGGEHQIPALKIQQTIADSMFVRIWEGGKCVLDNLNGFGLNTTYFDS